MIWIDMGYIGRHWKMRFLWVPPTVFLLSFFPSDPKEEKQFWDVGGVICDGWRGALVIVARHGMAILGCTWEILKIGSSQLELWPLHRRNHSLRGLRRRRPSSHAAVMSGRWDEEHQRTRWHFMLPNICVYNIRSFINKWHKVFCIAFTARFQRVQQHPHD